MKLPLGDSVLAFKGFLSTSYMSAHSSASKLMSSRACAQREAVPVGRGGEQIGTEHAQIQREARAHQRLRSAARGPLCRVVARGHTGPGEAQAADPRARGISSDKEHRKRPVLDGAPGRKGTNSGKTLTGQGARGSRDPR